ncbi:hypothetical protein DSL72_000637 [Monilinia vaccinii-corymbosi]|uniref:2EXR domain-containing protein n=1 Tax=Monilinia vaccinii-corymbosi TaxID=61207 RepID=A0A8A3P677_9HELO|nr:hypothetical protein DSL72_000637 [Monilinia vaccinii-corymbosi]
MSPGSITMHEQLKYCYHCDYGNSIDIPPIHCQNCRYSPKVLTRWLAIEERPKDFYDTENRDSNVNAFTNFKNLPPELRIKIWKLALPSPRVVLLHYYGRSNEYRSPMQISLASVCRESREIVQSLYVKTFGTETAIPKTWFNFEIDTLYIQRYNSVVGGNPNGFLDREKVRNFAVHLLEPSSKTEKTLHELLCIFRNVKVLINVQKRHNEPSQYQELELMDPINIDRLLAFSSLQIIREHNGTAQGSHEVLEDINFDLASKWPIELGEEASNFVSQSLLSTHLREYNEARSSRRCRAQTIYNFLEIKQMMVTTSSMAAKVRGAQNVYQRAEDAHKLLMEKRGFRGVVGTT